MASQPAKPQRRFHFGWRGAVVALLCIIGIVSLTAFSFAHWTERQILTTDNWVKVVGPLPKNNDVASALSTYTVNTIFTSLNIEQKIGQVLPPKADFLVPTLTSQLKSRLTTRTQQIIQSDQFESIWTNANRVAHQKLMEKARQTAPPKTQTARFNLNLSALKSSAESLLGSSNLAFLSSNEPKQASTNGTKISTELKTSLATFSRYVRTVDFLNAVLGLFALVCLVGALIISESRRRLLIVIGAVLFVIGLLEIIGVKALRPAILNEIHNVAYRPAGGVIYDTLVASFRNIAITGTIIGAVLAIIGLLTNPKLLAKSKSLSAVLNKIRSSSAGKWVSGARKFMRSYIWYFVGVIFLIGLVLLAFVFNETPRELLRSALIIILLMECVILVAARSRRLPM